MENSENDCVENDGSCKNCRFFNNYPDCYYKAEIPWEDDPNSEENGFEDCNDESKDKDSVDWERIIMRALKEGEGEKYGF